MVSKRTVVGVELIQDMSDLSGATEGYSRRHRHNIKTLLSDGTRSQTFSADFVGRRAEHQDAVAVILYSKADTIDDTLVLLHRTFRYAHYLTMGDPMCTETVAGIMESESAIDTTVREVYEEVGLEITPDQVRPLGPPFFSIPALFLERVHVTAVCLPSDILRGAPALEPHGDGSAFEIGAYNFVTSLQEAEQGCAGAEGVPPIDDAKTELVLARLRSALQNGRL